MKSFVIAALWTGTMLTTGFALRLSQEPEEIVYTSRFVRKLVVNSHVAYRKVFDEFVGSLRAANFTKWGDLIMVQGGSPTDKDPYVGSDGMTIVETTMNNYDFHGYAMISRHRHHPLVQADVYFYVLDSTMVGPCFPQVFEEMTVAPTEVITAGARDTSNICVFGHEVVDRYAINFENLFPLGETVNGVHPIGYFGEPWTQLPERAYVADLDLYGTGHPRKTFWYKDWDLYKAIFWGGNGDITGNPMDFDGNPMGFNRLSYRFQSSIYAKDCVRAQVNLPDVQGGERRRRARKYRD